MEEGTRQTNNENDVSKMHPSHNFHELKQTTKTRQTTLEHNNISQYHHY